MAIDQGLKRGDRAVVAAAATQDVGLLNTSGSLIDPATEAKQDDIISGIADLETLTEGTQVTRFGQTAQLVSDPEQSEKLEEISNTLKKIELHLRHMTGVAYGET